MDFDNYDLDSSIYDEMFLPNGAPREPCRRLHETLSQLSGAELGSIQERVTRSFSNEGITFTVYGDDEASERIIPVDCIPRVISGADWRQLETGLTQRLKALNLFLEDIYGEARIIGDGVIPVDVVRGCPQYRIEMRGFSPPHGVWAAICGTDLVRTREGFQVLEDNLRVPSGVSYMIANRKAVKASLRLLYRASHVREVERYGSILLATLRDLAPGGRPAPSIALLTPGVYNSAFYEHMFLAREIGAELVEGRDLLVNDGFVYMRTTKGLRRVDVIYRRVDDDFLDPLVFRQNSLLGVPGLMHACKLGNVTLVNAPGTGVADDKSVYAYVPDMIRYYLNEEPLLANVKTHLCRRPEDLEYTLDNLDNLVVKRVGESGGYGMLIGPHATPREREEYARQVRANPADFISQPVLALSRAPCLIDGGFEPRHVDLRPFVLCGRKTRIVPGAFCRVALRRGSLGGELQPGRGRQGPLGAARLMLSRSAQGLYWMSRYLERADYLCRLLRLQTEALVDRPIREIYFGWSRIYRSVNRQPPGGSLELAGSDDYALADSFTLADDLTFERSNPSSVWSCFALGRENARQTRQCINADMWACLNLAYLRIQKLGIQNIWRTSPESFYAEIAAEIDAFSGVSAATMYRDESWRFMQLGRFIERAQLSASLLLAQLALDQTNAEQSDADWTSLLRICHAFDVYNHRYSVDVQPGQVLDLLATDPLLPDSLCRSLDRTASDIAAIGPGPNAHSSGAARRLAGRLSALIHYDWPDRKDHEGLLRQVSKYCGELHNLVTVAYFEYPIEDTPTL